MRGIVPHQILNKYIVMWNPFKKTITALSEVANVEPVSSINLQILIAVEDMLGGLNAKVLSRPVR